MSEASTFNLPDVGEGLTEAEVVTWLVGEGDEVDINDALLEVETAKSVVELPSPYRGVVLTLHAAVGDTVPVGDPLVTIGARVGAPVAAGPSDEDSNAAAGKPHAVHPVHVSQSSAQSNPAPEPMPGTEQQPLILVGIGPKEAANRRIHVRRPKEGGATAGSIRTATGNARTGEAPAVLSASTPRNDTRLPVKGVRKATAEVMVRSAFTAPHASMWTTVDVTRTMDLVRALKADRAWADVRVSPLLVVSRIVSLAVRQFPEINASWDGEAQQIVLRGSLNLGIAAATPRGLMVPNIKDAGSLSFRELATTMNDLVSRARAGKLSPTEMSGGTLTITNVGTFGVEGATPILNPPEAVILAVGAVKQQPWIVDGTVKPREVMTLSISVDHRLVDGELGARALQFIADVLTNPAEALVRG